MFFRELKQLNQAVKTLQLRYLRVSTGYLQVSESPDIDLSFLEDETCKNFFPPQLKHDHKFKHRVFAIQPNMKDKPEKLKSTSAELQMSENCALVESIPNWIVADKAIHPLKRLDKNQVFGKGKLEELTKYIKQSNKDITAVMLGIDTLNSNQMSRLQNLWNVPVYDRYTIILEIFRARAITNEAKLQVSLAECHYLRSILHGIHSGSLDHQKEGLKLLGGMGETFIETRKALLKDREMRIEKELEKLKNQRHVARANRKRLQIPLVAVVGYTNAGKTSLIKCLTKNENLTPKNQLFATLDISSFIGYLPNKMKVLYFDTIGFISNIHPSLFNAFSATLQDISYADVLVLVSDASHPNRKYQESVVKQTLAGLPNMPKDLLNNMIHVYNKTDLLSDSERDSLARDASSASSLLISVKEGWNRNELMLNIQEAVVKATGRVVKKFKVPAGGHLLQLLYKESDVEDVVSDPNNPEMYLVKTTMTNQTYAKFCKLFKLSDRKNNSY